MRHLSLVQPRLAVLSLLAGVLDSIAPYSAAAEAAPDAREILKSVRVAQSAQNHTLIGQLRTGPKKVPFQLSMRDGVARWQFSDPPQTIVLRLGDDSSTL